MADLPFGAQPMADGTTRFRLWAPAAKTVDLVLFPDGEGQGAGSLSRPSAPDLADFAQGQRVAMPLKRVNLPGADGTVNVHEWQSAQPLTDRRYSFLIDGSTNVPDPSSRFNPEDVNGTSLVVDPRAYVWQKENWRGRPWHEFIIYELHVGTFTERGTFAAAAQRLDHLVSLGVTAIEIMPIADFPGRRNWGYDGVLMYAPDAAYGTPDDFKRFIDQAHQRGLAVILDVVYNHFGPQGNHLVSYAPMFFNDRHQTPWGDAINFDRADAAAVRAFYRSNALYWIEEFFLDGLRLDAVHAIKDESPRHFLEEVSAAVRRATDRHVHLILENEDNQSSWLQRRPDGTPATATAQWNDDVHHALHCLITGEKDGYYADFADSPASLLAKGLAHGFIYQGQISCHAGGKPRGEPSDALPALAFVNFLQNHDQVGNRAFGERIGQTAPPAAVRAAAACILLGPAVPMIFMGEEFDASSPFQYFCDFEGKLADAVRDGRRREFARFGRFADPNERQRIPDPSSEATFRRSRLDWSEAGAGEHAAMLGFYRECLQIRRRVVQPLLAHGGHCTSEALSLSDRAFVVRWAFDGQGTLTLAANFSADDCARVPAAMASGAPTAAVESAFQVNRITTPTAGRITLGPWGVALFRT